MRTFDYSSIHELIWDSEILSMVGKLHEHKGKQALYLDQLPETLETLIEIAKIQSTEASNRIEGIITTTTRIKDLCLEKTTPKNRDEEEIVGYRDALSTIHESYEYIPIQSSYILQLHGMLYKYSDKSIGGKYKNAQNIIAETSSLGIQKIRFTPLSPLETPSAIEELCNTFTKTIDSEKIDPLVLIPIFILDFLCIHPFNDGNGRMSRLLTTLLLYRSGYVVGKYISLESKIEKTKETYYEVLESCGIHWHEEKNNPLPFIKYLLGILLAAYRDFEDRVDYFEDKLPAIEQVKRAISKRIGKFTKTDIMEYVPSIKRASVENSLKQLVEQGFIVRYGKGKATFYVRSDAVT